MKLWAKREEEDVGREVVNSLSSAVVPGLAPSAIIPSSSTAAAGFWLYFGGRISEQKTVEQVCN